MNKRLDGELSTEELTAMTDKDIDFSDIPELGDEFWKDARLVEPDPTTPVTLRIKNSVLEAFKAQGRGYQTRMKAVLETYARTLRK